MGRSWFHWGLNMVRSNKDDVQRLSKMLEVADPLTRKFQEHESYFTETPSIRPVVKVSPMGVEVLMSKKLMNMPDEALIETFDQVYARMDNPNLPRFGPKAVAYLQSDGFIDTLRKGLTKKRFISDPSYVAYRFVKVLDRLAPLMPEAGLVYNIRRLDIKWRLGPGPLDSEYIASTDPLMQVIRIDARLAHLDIPRVLLDYVVFREVLAVAAYDHAFGRVDLDLYSRVHNRFPDADRMSSLCMELGWPFTIPLECER